MSRQNGVFHFFALCVDENVQLQAPERGGLEETFAWLPVETDTAAQNPLFCCCSCNDTVSDGRL